jgi:dTDP-4-dehydrorhamnose reductase
MEKERVFVLGHRGMLGHMVAAFLESRGCEAVTSPLRYRGLPQDPLLCAARDSGCKWIVNAIGLIKQKSTDGAQLFQVNTVLPLHIVEEMGAHQRLIHASTDCVFSGRRGSYAAGEPKDAEDAYGLSKALGEHAAADPRALVMRVSIIGPDLGSGAGLFGWFLRQKSSVRGYTNHLWNGITTLEWAKAAWEVIHGGAPRDCGLVQLGVRQPVSKHELLLLFREFWPRDIDIQPSAPPPPVDRTLRVDWERPPLRQQFAELRDWMQSGSRENRL